MAFPIQSTSMSDNVSGKFHSAVTCNTKNNSHDDIATALTTAEVMKLSENNVTSIIHVSRRQFLCYKCRRYFDNEINLKIHLNEERIICANPSVFHMMYKLMRLHPLLPPEKINLEDRFECSHCDQRFANKRVLKIHILCYHPCIKKFKCDHCIMRFVTECDLAEHRQEHSAEKNLICQFCGGRRPNSIFSYEIDKSRIGFELCVCKKKKLVQKENKKQIHRINEKSESNATTPQNKNIAAKSPVVTTLTANNISETRLTAVTAEIRTVVARSQKSVDNKSRKSTTACNKCDQECFSKLKLKLHKRLHIRRVDCEICGKSYSKHYIDTHKLIHGQEKKFVCDTCGKSFAQFSSLRSHLMLEMNFKKFICNFCGMQFVLSSRLQSHLKTHMETQPFKCEHCEKQFGYVWQLRQHSIKHSNIRSFVCEICARAYKTSRHLKQHYAVHKRGR